MAYSTIFVLIGLLALGLLYRLRRGGTSPRVLENPADHIRSVDIQAFRNLIDPAEEEFLRRNLPAAEFRAIRRERLLAAVEYISCAAQNAAILLRVGEAAHSSPDAAVAEEAQRLMDSAIRLRLYAFQTISRLYLGIVFPGWAISSQPVAESYEQVTRQVVRLGLQYPLQGVSAAL